MAVCAVLAGARTFAAIADWLADLDEAGPGRVGFTSAVPVASRLWRVFTGVDADAVSACLAGWLHRRDGDRNAGHGGGMARSGGLRPRRVVAVDGKSLRGARRGDGGRVHLLAGYDTATGIVLA